VTKLPGEPEFAPAEKLVTKLPEELEFVPGEKLVL
jgi:hypothetical protein